MVAQIDPAYRAEGTGKVLRRLVSYALFEGRPHTTRGQWFNPVVLTLLRSLAAAPGTPSANAPIFLTGLGRSGTTILGLILSLHRHVGFLNEPKAMWSLIDPLHDVTGDYGRGPARFFMPPDRVDATRRRRAQRLYARYARAVGARRVLDKYPELIFRIDYVRALFPDARFILITRNGPDACRSISTWSDRKGRSDQGGKEDWWGRDDCKWRYLWDELVLGDPELADLHAVDPATLDETHRAAVEWVVTMREGLHQLTRHPAAIHHVRYEDLVASPDAALRTLLAHCQLPQDDAVLRYATSVLYGRDPASPPKLLPALAAPFTEVSHHLGYPV